MSESINITEQFIGFSRYQDLQIKETREACELKTADPQGSEKEDQNGVRGGLLAHLFPKRLNAPVGKAEESESFNSTQLRSLRSGLYALLPFKELSDSPQAKDQGDSPQAKDQGDSPQAKDQGDSPQISDEEKWPIWIDRYYLRGGFLTILFSFQAWEAIAALLLKFERSKKQVRAQS